MVNEEKLIKIFEKIGVAAVIEQALEECGEFSKAAAKHLRIMRGVNYTPVKLTENSCNLMEETADIMLCLELLQVAFSPNRGKTRELIEGIKAAKLDRWLDRLGVKA